MADPEELQGRDGGAVQAPLPIRAKIGDADSRPHSQGGESG